MTTVLRVFSVTMLFCALATAAYAGELGQKRVPHVTVEVLGTGNWDNVGDVPNAAVTVPARRGQRPLPAAGGALSARKAEMVRRLFWIAVAAR